MQRARALYASSIGKKVVMAVSGVLLFGFVIGHMAGNLKIYQGPEKFDAYAHFLRVMGKPVLGEGQALWIARVGLLVALVLHVGSAILLTVQGRRARPHRYEKQAYIGFSYASRTMRWGGVIIAAFVLYHLMHLTWGNAHPDFEQGSAYHNVVSGFRQWPAAVAYLVAMIPLCLHLYHGVWSAMQTLSVDNPRITRWRRPAAAAVALGVLVGNGSIPLAVLAGLIE
jgi:succinate dehydrogenase / fumarate reductase cytochrome b subunit